MLVPEEHTTMEVTCINSPGLLSEMSAALAELHFHVLAAEVWTHNGRAACIMYLANETTRQPIIDERQLQQIKEQVESVVGAHGGGGGVGEVSVGGPRHGRIHTERRLHQLMSGDGDYEEGEVVEIVKRRKKDGMVDVSIDSWKDKGYSVVNVKSRDRPKLLFDTVCTLTDMNYVVFHATISSHGSMAVQVRS